MTPESAGLTFSYHSLRAKVRGTAVGLRYELAIALAGLAICAVGQEPVVHNGEPALRFSFKGATTHVHLVQYQGEPALRFMVSHFHYNSCRGYLYLTRTRIAYDPVFSEAKWKQDAFDQPRTALEARATKYGEILVVAPARKYDFSPLFEEKGRLVWWTQYSPKEMSQFFQKALVDFDAALSSLAQLGAGPEPPKPKPSEQPLQPGRIRIAAQPGGVQVYVNDQFKGITSSEEGLLVIADLKPGSYRLRLAQPGYKDWTEERTVAAGETLNLEAKLTPAGPKPLSADEVEEALRNGISNKRVMGFVRQFGVDFALTEELEQRLRAAGADDTLLLAITKAKK